jgi:hypothetical protein
MKYKKLNCGCCQFIIDKDASIKELVEQGYSIKDATYIIEKVIVKLTKKAQ